MNEIYETLDEVSRLNPTWLRVKITRIKTVEGYRYTVTDCDGESIMTDTTSEVCKQYLDILKAMSKRINGVVKK